MNTVLIARAADDLPSLGIADPLPAREPFQLSLPKVVFWAVVVSAWIGGPVGYFMTLPR
jgi:hypothetical protein